MSEEDYTKVQESVNDAVEEYKKEHHKDGIGMTIAEYNEAIEELMKDKKNLTKRVNDLTILLSQILEQDEADFFEDNLRTMDRQNIRRILKAKFPLTPEQMDIVNKNKQAQQNMNNSNVI